MQRSAIMAGGDFLFGRARLLQREFRSEIGPGIQARTELAAALQVAFGQGHGRKRALANAGAEFANGQIENFFAEHGYCRGVRGIEPQAGGGRVSVFQGKLADPHQHALVAAEHGAHARFLFPGQTVAIFADDAGELGIHFRLVRGRQRGLGSASLWQSRCRIHGAYRGRQSRTPSKRTPRNRIPFFQTHPWNELYMPAGKKAGPRRVRRKRRHNDVTRRCPAASRTRKRLNRKGSSRAAAT